MHLLTGRIRTVAIVLFALSSLPTVAAQAPPPGQAWHADYHVIYLKPTSANQAIDADGPVSTFRHGWRFVIMNGSSSTLLNPTVTVSTALSPLFPFPAQGSTSPYTWTGPTLNPPGPGSMFSASLDSNLVAPSYRLGYDVERNLGGSPIVPAGPPVSRTFVFTVTPRDPSKPITDITVGLHFNPSPLDPLPPMPAPVRASGLSCTPSADTDLPPVSLPSNPPPGLRGRFLPNPSGGFWEVGGAISNMPLPLGVARTLTCTVTLTNSSPHPVAYIPRVFVTGAHTVSTPNAGRSVVSHLTNSGGNPSDPLGNVVFTVTPFTGSARGQFDHHFDRSVSMHGLNLPAVFTAVPSSGSLWPPNHKMVPITINVSGPMSGACSITQVASSEPIDGQGDGDTAPDWTITGPLSVDLRAERSGNGNGRVYSITITCTAGSFELSKIVAVAVPHDQAK